ncbi:SLT1 protein [Zostera marina]|uniref:SLT1 protein n=1 Tax=Zostera marina TaxID=29655 RepID=A0A0K9PXW8_ZOSMR|nr:SLT1 protein [Zostera marina]
MGESHLTTLSMENNHPSTLLSMDPTGALPSSAGTSHEENDRDMMMVQRPQQQQQNHAHLHHQTPKQQQIILNTRPPDINLLPLSVDRSPPPPPWNSSDSLDVLDVGLGTQIHDSSSKAAVAASRKCAKRGDSIWGAWFFFSYYFQPVLLDKSKGKVTRNGNGVVVGFDKSDLWLDVFLVQHDMENMYMWVFKERPENSLGKMQLRSFMNGHSRLGEPQFPFSAEKGFVRSHRMQRKQYRGLSNPQCVHGIEVVKSPNLGVIAESDHKKWIELTGRDINFSIPNEASDFSSWRNLPNTEFALDRPLLTPALKTSVASHPQRKLLNGAGAGLNLGGGNSHPQQPLSNNNGGNSDGMELSPVSNNSKRRKDFFSHGMDEDRFLLPLNSPYLDHLPDIEMHHSTPPPQPPNPQWLNEFTGVMKHSYGPVTAAKTIYEDEEGYLIMVSLPFSDLQKVKVSWRNTLTHGIVKISCVSTARMTYIKRHERTFKLTDPSPEHCPPGEFVREIPLTTRIPEDANLEAYFDETGTVLEIIVPKLREGPEEHEVRVCMRPLLLGPGDLL